MTFSTTLQDFHSKAFRFYVPISKDVADQFIDGDNRRVLFTLDGIGPSHSALMNMEGGYYILVKTELKKKLRKEEGDTVEVTLEKDRSEYGHEVPESFEALLAQDDEGRERFERLTMGKQRSLIYIVKKVKNVDSQIAKGLAIMHQLKEAQGMLDFKRLNELIKEYNNRK